MDSNKLISDKEEQELSNKWIEKRIWEKANSKYPNDPDKANDYFKTLMSDTAELAELHSEFKSKNELTK